MKLVSTLTHTPEQCPARDGYRNFQARWVGSMRKAAKKLGVKINGAYVSPNEHTLYLVLESDSMESVTE